MPSSPTDTHTSTLGPPDLTASPVRPRLRPEGVPGQTLGDCVPRPPIFDGDAVSEPAATASPHCVPAFTIRPLITDRTETFWTEVYALLRDGCGHDTADLIELGARHGLAPRTIENLIPRAARRRWLSRSHGVIVIRDRNAFLEATRCLAAARERP